MKQHTLFAPTNDALQAAGVDIDALISADTPEELFALVGSTAVEGRITADLLNDPATSPLTMLSGDLFDLAVDASGNVTIDGSEISAPPTLAFNGVIHPVTTLDRN